MKRKKCILTEETVVFYPLFEAGVIVRLFTIIFGVLFALLFILTITNMFNVLSVSRICEATVLLFASFSLFLINKLTCRRMVHTTLTVSKVGIVKENRFTDSVRRIFWEDVFRIYFYKDPWYGRTSCRIFLKSSKQTNITDKSPCDFSLPLPSDIVTNVLPFIPQELWGNDPFTVY